MKEYTVYIEKEFRRIGAVKVLAYDDDDLRDVVCLLFPAKYQFYSQYFPEIGVEFWIAFE